MKEYPSIETVWVRDDKTKRLQFGNLRLPEVNAVREWHISEKVDGTNVRVIVTLDGITVKGRTDKAEMPPGLVDAVLAALPSHGELIGYFTGYRGKELPEQWSVTFYGEGYGPGIQKGGKYSDQKRFRVFDLLLGESWWTDDPQMRKVCADLNIPTVPMLGIYDRLPVTLSDLEFVIPYSLVGHEGTGQFAPAEGVVAKPPVVLLDRHGHRVQWKLTFREFK